MSKVTLLDVMLFAGLAVVVPIMVSNYLKRGCFSSSTQFLVIIGGLLWLVFAFFCESISEEVLGAWMWDAYGHQYWGEDVANKMAQGDWGAVYEYFRTGNRAYHCYVGLISWAGGSVYSATVLNGFFCFWGGLTLVRDFGSLCPYWQRNRIWIFGTLFVPSVVFWGTMNLKEGLMYWSICSVLNATFEDGRKGSVLLSPRVLIALIIGTLLRPHVIIGWAAAVAAATILQGGRRGLAVVILLVLPLIFTGARLETGVGLSTESALDMAETQFVNLESTAGGSVIDYGGGKPIFLVSGIVSAFLRPFPWKVGSLRVLVSSLEVWTMTIVLLVVWVKSGFSYGSVAMRLPPVRASILGVAWMCVLLSYFPNEGLVVRQRVQMVPGLLALTIVPFFVRETIRERFEYHRKLFNQGLQPAE